MTIRGSRRWVRAGATAVALVAALTVTAMAGRAPLTHSKPFAPASAQAPVAALFLLLMGAGLIAVTAVAILRGSIRRRRGADDPELDSERQRIALISQLLAIAASLSLSAALIGGALLGARALHPGARLGHGSSGAVRAPAAPISRRAGHGVFVLPGWVPWTALGIVLFAAFGVLLLLRGRGRVAEAPAERSAAQAAVEAAIEQLETIADPRSAVIAAYGGMERILATRGVGRSPAEAPREYLSRVLLATTEAGHEVNTLTTLFEEARFSMHPISERVRDLALASLASLRARLATPETV